MRSTADGWLEHEMHKTYRRVVDGECSALDGAEHLRKEARDLSGDGASPEYVALVLEIADCLEANTISATKEAVLGHLRSD